MIITIFVLLAIIIGGTVLGLFAWQKYCDRSLPKQFLQNKTVFISGCDSGFGEAVAIKLYELGFNVIAGCLTEKGIQNLKNTTSSKGSSGGLHPIKIDITNSEDINNLIKFAESKCSKDGLFALVNNAGIANEGPIEWTPVATFRRVMEVNYLGHVAVTKALLPLIRKGKGRVINISSLAGTFVPLNLAAYSAAKFALESFTDSLRREMMMFGVKVVKIAPGYMNTTLLDAHWKETKSSWDASNDEIKAAYTEKHLEKLKAFTEHEKQVAESPKQVVDKMVECVCAVDPSPKYIVGKLPIPMFILLNLPYSMLDKTITAIINNIGKQ